MQSESFGLVGNNVYLDERAIFFQRDKICLEDNVSIGMFATLNARPKVKKSVPEREGIVIRRNSRISPYSILESLGGFISIGEDCSIKEFCLLYGTGGINIGNLVRIGPRTSIVAENHIAENLDLPIYLQGMSYRGITISDDVWIGVHCIILDGVKIGKGCIIGAGSVVTKSIADYSVVTGNPARIIRQRK